MAELENERFECPSCNDSVVYSFDEIPGFFPPSWFR